MAKIVFEHKHPTFTVTANVNLNTKKCNLTISKSNTYQFGYTFDAILRRGTTESGDAICSINVSNMNKTYEKNVTATAPSDAKHATLWVKCGDTNCSNGKGGNKYHKIGSLTFNTYTPPQTPADDSTILELYSKFNYNATFSAQRLYATSKNVRVQVKYFPGNYTNYQNGRATNTGIVVDTDFQITIHTDPSLDHETFNDVLYINDDYYYTDGSGNATFDFDIGRGNLKPNRWYYVNIYYKNAYLQNYQYVCGLCVNTAINSNLKFFVGSNSISAVGTNTNGYYDNSLLTPLADGYTIDFDSAYMCVTKDNFDTFIANGGFDTYYKIAIPLTDINANLDTKFGNMSTDKSIDAPTICDLYWNTTYYIYLIKYNSSTGLIDDTIVSFSCTTNSPTLKTTVSNTTFRSVDLESHVEYYYNYNEYTIANDYDIFNLYKKYIQLVGFRDSNNIYNILTLTYGFGTIEKTDTGYVITGISHGSVNPDLYGGGYTFKKENIPVGGNRAIGSTGVPHSKDTYYILLEVSNSDNSMMNYSYNVQTIGTDAPAVRIWNGSKWKYAMPRVWNGSEWKYAFAKVWDGHEWRETMVLKYDSSSNSWIPKN